MKFVRYLVFLLFILYPLFATKVTLYDTPTALSMERGEYAVDSFFFHNGGMLLKVGAGINKYVNLGVIEYVYEFIGRKRPKFQIPHVYGHFRITSFGDEMVNFALGYNSLYHGSFSPFDKPSYGFYAVTTVGFPRVKSFLESPHFFHFGLRLPVYHQFAEPDLFLAFHLRFTSFFEMAMELNNIHFAKQYRYYFINNNVIIFNILDMVSINIAIQIAGRVKEGKKGVIPMVGTGLFLKFKGFF